jgi:hypothetical protein
MMVDHSGAAALLDLVQASGTTFVEGETEALALSGVERGQAPSLAPPAMTFPRDPAAVRCLAVEMRRRGAVLIVKRNSVFRIVGLLAVRESAVIHLLERARIAGRLQVYPEVIQLTPDPLTERGIRVRAVPPLEAMQLALRDLESLRANQPPQRI